ncbi:MAG: hypothetical protein LBD06_09735, partial [Candidatus Accumulibacter sp.]|nr:hypothetical protein [Accumulibacter sp.]
MNEYPFVGKMKTSDRIGRKRNPQGARGGILAKDSTIRRVFSTHPRFSGRSRQWRRAMRRCLRKHFHDARNTTDPLIPAGKRGDRRMSGIALALVLA